MAVVVAVSTAGTMALSGPRTGFGVLFGGLLSFVSFVWLDRSTRAIFLPDATRSAALMAVKFVLRYVFIGGALLLVYMTGAFPVAAVILGLAAFAIAVVVKGIGSIFTKT